MTKVICIYSFKESSWVSCQKIVFNLLSSYQKIKNLSITPFNYDQNSAVDDVIGLLKIIQDTKPDKIIFLDHKPHPLLVLSVLFRNMGKDVPPIIFHLFGDFTLYYKDWETAGTLLQGHDVTFVVPSERQKHLIDKFLVNADTHICPFPVERSEFAFDQKLRKAQRKEWGLPERAKVFVYTGRLSRQKRIHTLLKAFREAAGTEPDAHLYIYGQVDHVGDRFLNVWESEGEYYIRILRMFEALEPELQKRVHFMGNVDWKKLAAVYAASDYFISLSVHNDEDYGMSVAEAQASGLACIITDWGGFSSFDLKEVPQAVRFVPVRFGEHQKLVSVTTTVGLIKDALSEPLLERLPIAESSMSERSIEAASKTLKRILSLEVEGFQGFSAFFKHITYRIDFGKGLYLNKQSKISNLYKAIYESYLRKDQ